MQDGRELAEYTLNKCFDEGIHSKVDVFNLCRVLDANYVPSDLDDVDGIYITERRDGEKILNRAIIGLNINKVSLRRLKFTLAHELCHHIKDFEKQQQVTLNEDLDIPYSKVEKFANTFASYLLVPHLKLKNKLDEFSGKKKLSDADIICLADYFEVSKSMITYRLDRLNISYELGSGSLSTDIDLKIKLQYIKGIFSNSKKLFDSYRRANIMEIVSNDSRFEGIKLEIEEISEIIFDIDGFLEEGKILSENEMQIIGLYYMYEKLLEENDIPDQYKLQDYHSYLYKMSKEYVKGFRRSDNYITGAKVQTPSHTKVQEEMYLLAKDIRFIFDGSSREVNLEFVNSLAKIHQKITWIHPFSDGNGRVSRLLNNWLLQLKEYPYMVIKVKDKDSYLRCLQEADEYNFKPLIELLIDNIYENYNDYILANI
ncbi:ImmA/IrrE family metallo-endopeptidase [Macrococcoides caseolyticum]|uniref:ImmA/IrrE family metallo-endopeptidase n=1 Tax=Macrococcoides caseolyticum TaxID=69966 RepID=UPI001F25F4CC|nr:Fic family protein [Macrococcus caseolyticus]MCE4956718.1 Fic family protein [Macrococcus caseolyticus]